MKSVFLHGYGADMLSWLGNQAALRAYDTMAPDLRGHGRAVASMTEGSLADLAEGVLEELGDGPPAWLVGHSLGGGVALWLAAHHPQRWRGLVLLAPLGLGERLNLARLQRYPDTADETEMMGFLEGLVFDKTRMLPEFATYAMSQLEKPGSRAAMRKIVDQIPEMAQEIQGLLPKVAESGVDATVFWGHDDEIVRPITDLIGTLGPLTILPKVGHIPHVEAPEIINAHLRDRFELT